MKSGLPHDYALADEPEDPSESETATDAAESSNAVDVNFDQT
jgi:hypothetical protein